MSTDTSPREAEMTDYQIGTRYQIRIGPNSAKRFRDAIDLIKKLGEPVYDAQGKTWTATVEDLYHQSYMSTLTEMYSCTITEVSSGDERAALLLELRTLNARRAEIMRTLGTLTDVEVKAL